MVFTSSNGNLRSEIRWTLANLIELPAAFFASIGVLTPHQHTLAIAYGCSPHLLERHGSCISPLSKCSSFRDLVNSASLLSIHAARFKLVACRLMRSALLVLDKRRRSSCSLTQRMKLVRLMS